MLAFCESDENSSKLIRKYHFDYDKSINDMKKPLYHLQYGGKLSPNMIYCNVTDDNDYSWLSIPRINFTPINLALLIDFIFVEFKSPVTESIIERTEWRQFIKTNEELMLQGYYKCVNQFFSRGNHTANKLFRDFSYGK
jgi:hypothetical protein